MTHHRHHAFGKFGSFEEFIDSYQRAEQSRRLSELHKKPVAEQPAAIRGQRDVVQVQARVDEREPDEQGKAHHYRLLVSLTAVQEADDEVKQDVEAALGSNTEVFLAIRYGDRMGILQPIEGLAAGIDLKLRGVWIPRDRAYSHGGVQRPVLHFTHHPVGFVCTPQQCYS